eukprot:468771-Prymnesium_polylepis.1
MSLRSPRVAAASFGQRFSRDASATTNGAPDVVAIRLPRAQLAPAWTGPATWRATPNVVNSSKLGARLVLQNRLELKRDRSCRRSAWLGRRQRGWTLVPSDAGR